jgi:hypothetical protein
LRVVTRLRLITGLCQDLRFITRSKIMFTDYAPGRTNLSRQADRQTDRQRHSAYIQMDTSRAKISTLGIKPMRAAL